MPRMQRDWLRARKAADAPRRWNLFGAVQGVSWEGKDRQLRRPYSLLKVSAVNRNR
jgi:hypothetical protein